MVGVSLRRIAVVAACVAAVWGCGDSGPNSGDCPGTNPAPPSIGGLWTISAPEIVDSSCSAAVDAELLALIAGPGGSCVYDVDQNGNSFTAVECHDETITGCVTQFGDLFALFDLGTTTDGCAMDVDIELNADSARSPSTAQYQLGVTFAGAACGALDDCNAVINAVWDE